MADFVIKPARPTADDELELLSLSRGPFGSTLRCSWTIDGEEDDDMEGEENWMLSGLEPGEHVIKLTVEDQRGQRAEVTKRVVIRP